MSSSWINTADTSSMSTYKMAPSSIWRSSELGGARTMTIPPNVKYAELFSEAQQEAREQGRGSWK